MDAHNRTFDQIAQHYRVEKRLAKKLRNASPEDRQRMYSILYEELFRMVPHHPQLLRALSADNTYKSVSFQMRNIRPFLGKHCVFLELGAGDCALSIEVAKWVDTVYAVDITRKNIVQSRMPHNFKFVLSDGCSIPIEEKSVDIAYSYQLMEHLHPDDAAQQLRNVYKVLTPGGVYICDTPNRLSGPHDISGYFDRVATGFHLKEYTFSELSRLFTIVGFSRMRVHIRLAQIHISLPVFMGKMLEVPFHHLPDCLRRQVTSTWPFKLLLGVRLIGTK
jgi:SAM-dependent methyltransferase